MKVLLLAGGFGTRLGEETDVRPKPMVEIGGKPILWHIMKMYSSYGYREFVVLLGYKGYYIKEYFANYFLHQSDVTIDLKTSKLDVYHNTSEPWRITLLNTGVDTMTGGRVKRAQEYVGNETFMLTYGDGVSDVNFDKLLQFHRKHGKAMTMTSVQPDGRFGTFEADEKERVNKFLEKPRGDGSWVNGGFFVCEVSVFDYITLGDATVLEREPLEGLARDGELYTYRHEGFWKCMDTLRDRNELEAMWAGSDPQWKTW
ncbi:MAG: Glucose-1-phosphate cytidylyltransferase [Verrucomicrobia subdivision 3 bacterium]|nr:Glucose-1-phosphate cytidylyltransferase [Limisphaerales bacterium]MCS1415836.1 Glucose-1-phosphate cytidylyltransferase [Limisphaerales bacterium]